LISAVEVVGLAIHQSDETSRDTGGRASEAVIQTHLETSDIEVIEITIESCVTIAGLESAVVLRVSETLAEEISNVTKNNQNQIADVGGKDEIVRRLIFDRRLKGLSMRLAGVSMTWVKERAELGICSFLAVDLLSSLGLEESSRRSIDAVGVARARSRERNGW
jgi:hypothetical protein